MAAENILRPAALAPSQRASMRPRRMAAENAKEATKVISAEAVLQ